MEYDMKQFSKTMPLLKDFLYHLASYRELSKVYEDLKGDIEFWVYTCDAHIQMAIISWCKIFGAYNEKTHYHCIFTNEKENKSFRKYVISKLNLSNEEYDEYFGEMRNFRNKYAAHREDFEQKVPNLDCAYKVVLCFDEWVRKNIGCDIWSEKSFDKLYEKYCEKVATTLKTDEGL